MQSQVTSVRKIDQFGDMVNAFLDNMPDKTRCEIHLLVRWNGYEIPRCENSPAVTHLETEHDLCLKCFEKYERGFWRPWR